MAKKYKVGFSTVWFDNGVGYSCDCLLFEQIGLCDHVQAVQRRLETTDPATNLKPQAPLPPRPKAPAIKQEFGRRKIRDEE